MKKILHYPVFWAGFLLLLSFGAWGGAAGSAGGTLAQFAAFAVVFAAGGGLQTVTSGTRWFWKRALPPDVRRHAQEESREGFTFCGALLEPEAEPSGPDQAFAVLSQWKSILLRWACGVALGMLAWKVFPWAGLPALSAPVLLNWVAAVSLLYAATLGHLLIALGLNLGIALFWARGWGFWVPYSLLLSITFLLYRRVELEISHPSFHAATAGPTPRLLWRAAQVAAFALAVGWGVNALMPEPAERTSSPRQASAVSPPWMEKAQLLNRYLGKKISPGAPTPPARPVGATPPSMRPPAIDRAALEKLFKELGSLPDPRASAGDAAREQRELLGELARRPPGTDGKITLSPEELKRLEKLAEQLRHLKISSPSGSSATASPGAERPAGSASPLAPPVDLSPKEFAQAAEQLSQALQQAQLESKAPADRPGAPPSQPEARPPAQSEKEPELIPRAVLERLLKFLVFLGKSSVVLFLVYLGYRLLKRRDPRALEGSGSRRGLSRAERRTLRQELARLDAMGLPLREEIILKYHFFLKVLARAGLERPRSTPPMEYARAISPKLPWISGEIQGVTECFSDAFYGSEVPEAQRLRDFRAQVHRTLEAINP